MLLGRIPDVHADGRWRSGDDLDAVARRWRMAILDATGDRHRVLVAAVPPTTDGVALFAALSSLPFPPALVSPDVRWWPNAPLPPDATFVLLPSLAHLAPEARERGCRPYVLPEADSLGNAPALTPLSGPGVIMFSSGSTGVPKPIFRPTGALLDAAATRAAALGLVKGDGIIVGVTLVHGQGMNMLLAAMLLEGRLGFLSPVNHRAALATLAMPEFACWRATPHFVDVLGRCTLTGPPIAPPVCLISSPLSDRVFDTFLERFGVPVRQGYASGETGPIAVDNRPANEVRPGTVGRLLPRVEVRIGEHPDTPLPAGEMGRIWVRSPFGMGGYGYPPDLDRPGMVDGWWPSRDLGAVHSDGLVTLAGRIDDCIRTRDGRLVNLAAVASMVRALDSIRQVAVVALDSSAGAAFGAVIECDAHVPPSAVTTWMADALPPWARPRKVVFVPALPLLANGKPDRIACVAALDEASR